MTISEFCKFLLSTGFFFREWRQRTYAAVPSDAIEEQSLKLEAIEEGGNEDGESSGSVDLDGEDYASLELPSWMQGARGFRLSEFIEAIKGEVSTDVRYGFVHLALLYVVMNNMVSAHSTLVGQHLSNPRTRFLSFSDFQIPEPYSLSSPAQRLLLLWF